MGVGRILTQGLGVFGGRRFLPTLGYSSLILDEPGGVQLCVEETEVYSPGSDANGVYSPGTSMLSVYKPGSDMNQVGCC